MPFSERHANSWVCTRHLKTLETAGSMEIGLKSLADSASFNLGTGVVKAFFHSKGVTPVDKLQSKREVKD